jgi:hypothetical protein
VSIVKIAIIESGTAVDTRTEERTAVHRFAGKTLYAPRPSSSAEQCLHMRCNGQCQSLCVVPAFQNGHNTRVAMIRSNGHYDFWAFSEPYTMRILARLRTHPSWNRIRGDVDIFSINKKWSGSPFHLTLAKKALHGLVLLPAEGENFLQSRKSLEVKSRARNYRRFLMSECIFLVGHIKFRIAVRNNPMWTVFILSFICIFP